MNRLQVQMKGDSIDNDFLAGDIGYIDGYVQGGNNVPYAVVWMPDRAEIVLAPLHQIKVLTQEI